MLKITMGKGFQITFENGVTASVQFGLGNYCENSNNRNAFNCTDCDSENAEVAAILDGDFITCQVMDSEDDVIGYMDSMAVLNFLNKCAQYKV